MGGILWDYSVCFDRDPETAGYSQPFCHYGKILRLCEGERELSVKKPRGKATSGSGEDSVLHTKYTYFTILFKNMHFQTVCLYEENDSPTEDLRGAVI